MARSRMKMKLLLKKQEFALSWNCRTVSEQDIHPMGELMLDSFRDTIDYEGETLDDAISEIQGTIAGKYGPLLRKCSFAIEQNGQVLSACLVTFSMEANLPLIAYSMTHPDFKNQGMGTFLLKKSINALFAQGYKEVYLLVTRGNVAAQHLYEKIGFQVFE